jgi:hypothetical protein
MKNFRCEIGVAAGEIRIEHGEEGIQNLIEEFNNSGIEVIEMNPGLYNCDEDWIVEGSKENLEFTLNSLGWDLDQLEFEEF